MAVCVRHPAAHKGGLQHRWRLLSMAHMPPCAAQPAAAACAAARPPAPGAGTPAPPPPPPAAPAAPPARRARTAGGRSVSGGQVGWRAVGHTGRQPGSACHVLASASPMAAMMVPPSRAVSSEPAVPGALQQGEPPAGSNDVSAAAAAQGGGGEDGTLQQEGAASSSASPLSTGCRASSSWRSACRAPLWGAGLAAASASDESERSGRRRFAARRASRSASDPMDGPPSSSGSIGVGELAQAANKAVKPVGAVGGETVAPMLAPSRRWCPN